VLAKIPNDVLEEQRSTVNTSASVDKALVMWTLALRLFGNPGRVMSGLRYLVRRACVVLHFVIVDISGNAHLSERSRSRGCGWDDAESGVGNHDAARSRRGWTSCWTEGGTC